MSKWTQEQVKEFLVGKGWYQSEIEIQRAIQFILVGGVTVDCYNSGSVVVGGKFNRSSKRG